MTFLTQIGNMVAGFWGALAVEIPLLDGITLQQVIIGLLVLDLAYWFYMRQVGKAQEK